MPVVETIDTSRMNTAQRAALELTESARDEVRESFAGSLFLGRCEAARLLPFPLQPLEDADQGDAFLHWLKGFLREKVDADAIDCDGEIPRAVIAELARMGAFGIKVPPRYGGLGLSQTNYCRAAMLLGQPLRQPHRTVVRAPVHWCAAAVAALWHGGAEAGISAASGAWRNFRFCAHRERGGQRSRAHDDHRRAHGRRAGVHIKWRETLVHQRHGGRRDSGDCPHAITREPPADDGVYCRDQLARRGGGAPLPVHGPARAVQRRDAF